MATVMNPLMILQARAAARAALFAACEYENLGEAIDPLLEYAHTSGIVDEVGVEQTWQVIRDAFAGVAEI